MNRPAFTIAWAASQRIYDPTSPSAKVAKVIGGKVAQNINNPDPASRWENTCAVRMSYILNESGARIPYIPTKTSSGADKRWYFYRVEFLIEFLKQQWGVPEVVAYPPANGGPIDGKKGVILFEVLGWSNATGHATLFNGQTCYDHCYFNEPSATYRTQRANFWALP